MGIDLNSFNQKFILAVILLFIIAIIVGINLLIALSRSKKLNLENHECLICKDDILKEFRNIRHEYNNILQGLVCIIEEEDWEELIGYKDCILKKTQILNKSNLTQLIRIKNKNILRIVYSVLIRAKEAGITMNLNIYNDIDSIEAYRNDYMLSMQDYIEHAYEVAASESEVINLKISANELGLCFAFENKATDKACRALPNSIKSTKSLRRCKNLLFNSFIQNDYQIQEILFSF
jgi:hypothetical protein